MENRFDAGHGASPVALLGAALLLVGGSQAFADENGRRLIMVTADTPSKIDQLQGKYDVGYVGEPTEAAVYLDSEEEALLRAQGYELGEVVEDHKTWLDRRAEIDATTQREPLAKEFAQRGMKGGAVRKGKRIVALPGEVVIMRAYTFTNYAGRFLYVEAHDKAHTTTTGPALQMAYSGPDGVFRPPYAFATGGIAPDANDNPTGGNKLNDAGQYMYHRILRPLLGADANLSAQDITVRVASSTGAFDTSAVTEWAGSQLPARVAKFQKDFITKYMDPTEVYGRIDQIAQQYPGIAEIVNLPEKTAGYQRKSMAIMSGTGDIGTAPPAVLGNPLIDTTGEITAAQPVAAIPFTATAGQSVFATVDGIPSGSTDFIFRLKDPSGTILTTIDTGTSPEFITRTFTTAGTYTFEVLGFQGDLGDFTLKIQPIVVTAAEAAAGAVVLTAKAWGHQGGNQIRAEFRNPGAPNSPLTVAVAPNDITGWDITVNLATNSSGALTSTAAQVVAAINASAAASALVTATTWTSGAGAGIVQVRARVQLSDFLNAPPSVQRGPFQQRVLRIGKQRDGSKIGVFIYCQQHAREWVTPITCLETAERLVRNYATDPTTKAYVDNLDIFILPSVEPGRRALLDVRLERAAQEHGQLLPGDGDDRHAVRPQRLGRRPEPQQHDRDAVRRLLGREHGLQQRDLRGPVREVRAGDPERAVGRETHSRRSSSRSTSTPTAATSCGRRARTSQTGRVDAAGAEHRDREVLLRRVGDDPVAHQVVARHGRAAAAHGPDRRRAVLGRGQLGR